jgi:hypothetical protein
MLESLVRKPLQEMAVRFHERSQEKMRGEIVKLFPDVSAVTVVTLIDTASTIQNPEFPLTRKQLLIKAVIEGLGPQAVGKYQDHPDSNVKYVADLLAWEQFGSAIATSMNQRKK